MAHPIANVETGLKPVSAMCSAQKTEFPCPDKDKFGWQDGYGAFSVSKSSEATVIQYIRNQQEHHRKKSFQEEFIGFLNKHGIEYDKKYLWE